MCDTIVFCIGKQIGDSGGVKKEEGWIGAKNSCCVMFDGPS